MLQASDWQAIWVTLQLAAVTTGVLLVLATPLAWWLAFSRSRWRAVVQALVAMPLVLPPTVLGFYLLLILSNNFAFTFTGIVIGSVIYSLPFAVQPLSEAFRAMGRRPLDIAASLGADRWDQFKTVVVPLCRGGFVVAATLVFAHTLGEFGVILMIGGSIPGETQVLSVLIYDHTEALNYQAAHTLSLGMIIVSLLVLIVIYGRWSKSPLARGSNL
ncbi:molybdate ABC transporter permease subunit [Pseudidiomarina terrestris]|uniref:Molybdenum transport system permease n=1 Tax=Pseudidiomarina terrestris TaxID=2820060 RepID=A0AAW7R0U3_9GAMM|nr:MULTISPECIES: molybdate ABC transporter permease subunit [unclassified Pseudidiomarina]MDN7124740.1 molybdate ABC transporter permease subunit [Pseudidiomarina sp. 1APP75-32.1]MDN7125797.1 molybdate ABC transporter permease subunit [Pseudidiomarina sp. 1APR75-33.1]MDN7129786.1 molybdate ABC transporter permease subunit [Pseudidiomarina sp. 1APR75-15]MDN7136437.1 molybdate ABC transporter permease subunit [Pseudidiomarina sp. 1ASP75-5]MEA3588273.1 molybdate ABC transporter permease subunit [